MSDPKDFVIAVESDVRKEPRRIAFMTRRTSPQVLARDEQYVMTYPEVFLRTAVAVEVLLIALCWISIIWNAPLEQLADPMHTPNPAKAPWYFLGLQELLHYFPPFVAGVIIPTLVIVALIVIPYFHVNVKGEGLWEHNRASRLTILLAVGGALSLLLIVFQVWVALVPTLLILALMAMTSRHKGSEAGRLYRWAHLKPLSFWIMTWFLIELTLLTIVGTFFRGPGWSWVWFTTD
jgi:hypothetical protein